MPGKATTYLQFWAHPWMAFPLDEDVTEIEGSSPAVVVGDPSLPETVNRIDSRTRMIRTRLDVKRTVHGILKPAKPAREAARQEADKRLLRRFLRIR
jgi:transposase